MIKEQLILLILHASTGSIALIIGITRILTKQPLIQNIFLTASITSNITGLTLLPYLETINLQLSFATLGIIWLYFNYKQTKNILTNNKEETWNTRILALLLFFITMRIWRSILTNIGIPPLQAYETATWLGWTINILITEYTIIPKIKKKHRYTKRVIQS